MVIAALLVFAALLVAWVLAPVDCADGTTFARDETREQGIEAEPLAQVA